jgi:hypothetical protein
LHLVILGVGLGLGIPASTKRRRHGVALQGLLFPRRDIVFLLVRVPVVVIVFFLLFVRMMLLLVLLLFVMLVPMIVILGTLFVIMSMVVRLGFFLFNMLVPMIVRFVFLLFVMLVTVIVILGTRFVVLVFLVSLFLFVLAPMIVIRSALFVSMKVSMRIRFLFGEDLAFQLYNVGTERANVATDRHLLRSGQLSENLLDIGRHGLHGSINAVGL